MFIRFDSTSFIIIVVFKYIQYYRLTDKSEAKKNSSIVVIIIIINTNMWWISRCISIDSLNSCFQQQKHRTSYDFCFCKEGSSIFEKRADVDDNDNYDLLPKKPTRHSHRHHHHPQQHHNRRRIPKRYSDIVGPSTVKILIQRKESVIREKKTINSSTHPHCSSTKIARHNSLKPITGTVYNCDSNRQISRDNNIQNSVKYNDLLAHRMQAAMSTELMHSLDRNFVFGNRKQASNHLHKTRSHSFNICASWNKKSELNTYQHLIPRVQTTQFQKQDLRSKEPTPDYDESNDDIFIRTIGNKNDIENEEEPIADYDDSKSNLEYDIDGKSFTHSELGVSSSFIIRQASSTQMNITDEHIPTSPSFIDLSSDQKKSTFRCRTIAENLSSNPQLIFKGKEEKPPSGNLQTVSQLPSKPHYFQVSKDNKLRKTSQSLSRSSYSSLTQINDHDTEITNIYPKPLITDEQIQDCLSSSSPATSTVHENEYQQRSSSSKIYNDYKKRASLTSIPTNTMASHSIIIHPMHTRIGLRSSTSSSSTNEKLTDMTLSSKQMNVCVINQLNEHLSTRFRKQQQSCSNHTDHLTYDPPPEHMSEINNTNHIQSTVSDQPNEIPVVKTECSNSIPLPPPPPPLPVGGFRSIKPSMNRSSQPQRISTMTFSRDGINSEIRCSTGTSTISSNLSDTRILSELRENPLFTRAKKHLDIEPGSNGRRSGRRLIGSTSNLTTTEKTINNETISYLRLDKCLKMSPRKPLNEQQQLETITIHPNELNGLLGKRTRSSNNINEIKSRSCTKSLISTPCRLSELELIFQKRAQRSEQNLT
ncbi:hypothetical protein I4U23_018982 [Adineta vaga]|nr:hypothetical protein I4U23_018982 [Adineta vaga]